MAYLLPQNPLPVSLPKECSKAAAILDAFANSTGLDGLIPPSVLQNARGFAILTVSKIGFLVSIKAGSGIVIARDEEGKWACPSAIATAGLGAGLSIGAEVEELLIILNTRKSVKAFMQSGSVTLGGSLSITAGPVGRNVEASGALSKKGRTAFYSYSRSKGAFLGVSLEGSALIERSDANAKSYHSDVTAQQLLSGRIEIPSFAQSLIQSLDRACGVVGGDWVEEDDPNSRSATPDYSFGTKFASGSSTPVNRSRSGSLVDKFRAVSISMSPSGSKSGSRSRSGSMLSLGPKSKAIPPTSSEIYNENNYNYSSPRMVRSASSKLNENDMYRFDEDEDRYGKQSPPPNRFENSPFDDPPSRSPANRSRSSSVLKKASPVLWNETETYNSKVSEENSSESEVEDFSKIPASFSIAGINSVPSPTTDLKPPALAISKDSIGSAIALYDLSSSVAGDLSFKKGDVIEIIDLIDQSEWMNGRLGSKVGIVPSTHVELHLH